MARKPLSRTVAGVLTAGLVGSALVVGAGPATAGPCNGWTPPRDGLGSLADSLGPTAPVVTESITAIGEEIGLSFANPRPDPRSGSLDRTAEMHTVPWQHTPGGYLPMLDGPTTAVQQVTGPSSPNRTIDRFRISGTDLGLTFEATAADGSDSVFMVFGDTMGYCLGDLDWRSNTMARSTDRDLSSGISIDSAPMGGPGYAKSLIPRQQVPGETTIIPTAGVEIGGTQYLRFMSVRTWDQHGEWTTNFSGLARSDDAGENWSIVPGTGRADSDAGRGVAPDGLLPGDTGNLPQAQMSAFLSGGDGYLYEYLTPSGRSGEAILARVSEGEIANLGAYTYWDGQGWSGDIGNAQTVLSGPVSEMSVDYNHHLGSYVALHTNAANDVVMRTAPSPQGPWGGEQIVLSHADIPTMYAPYIHPWSSGNELYFTMSTWDAYNVFLMRTDLDALRAGDQ